MLTIESTLPWRFTGAAAALDGQPYAIGVIFSENLGCAVVSIGYDGSNMADNIAKVNAAGEFIVNRCNEPCSP